LLTAKLWRLQLKTFGFEVHAYDEFHLKTHVLYLSIVLRGAGKNGPGKNGPGKKGPEKKVLVKTVLGKKGPGKKGPSDYLDPRLK